MTCILCNDTGMFKHISGLKQCYCQSVQASNRPNNLAQAEAEEGLKPAKGIINGLLISIMLWSIIITIFIWVR